MAKRTGAGAPGERDAARLRLRRTLQFAAWTLGIVAVVLAAGWLFIRGEQFLVEDPRFRIAAPRPGGEDPAITVTGARNARMSSILEVFAADRGRSLYRLDPAARRQALQRVEWVKDATVRRVWPNRVAVEIIERVPLAFLKTPVRASGGTTAYRPLLIDAEGVLLTPRGALPSGLPLVSGILPADHPEVRRDRIARARRLLDELGEAGENLDEIDVADPENLKVTYRIHEREYILALGDTGFSERFQRFVRGYPEWKNDLPPRALIDLTDESRVVTVPLPAAH